jgi:hypothetical protein
MSMVCGLLESPDNATLVLCTRDVFYHCRSPQGVNTLDLALLPQSLDTELMLQLTSVQFSAGFPNPSYLWFTPHRPD